MTMAVYKMIYWSIKIKVNNKNKIVFKITNQPIKIKVKNIILAVY